MQVPPQPFGWPHEFAGQLGWQWHWPFSHSSLPGQGPLQWPPQPSDAPHMAPLQLGVQQVPLEQVCPDGQAPSSQVPPQPSPEPQALPRQSGTQQVPP